MLNICICIYKTIKSIKICGLYRGCYGQVVLIFVHHIKASNLTLPLWLTCMGSTPQQASQILFLGPLHYWIFLPVERAIEIKIVLLGCFSSSYFMWRTALSCRVLVEQLANVNLKRLSCNEKLAFWINLYNALIMHVSFAICFLLCMYVFMQSLE